MLPYHRQAHYHETDQMGIIHHANYIRWFEEARVDFLDQLGFPYASLEAAGIYVPVLGVEATYKQMVRFGETVAIWTQVESCSAVKLTIHYEIWDQKKTTLFTSGHSQHCFLSKSYRPVSLKKTLPDLYAALQANLPKD